VFFFPFVSFLEMEWIFDEVVSQGLVWRMRSRPQPCACVGQVWEGAYEEVSPMRHVTYQQATFSKTSPIPPQNQVYEETVDYQAETAEGTEYYGHVEVGALFVIYFYLCIYFIYLFIFGRRVLRHVEVGALFLLWSQPVHCESYRQKRGS
jgi:hypothetical protein